MSKVRISNSIKSLLIEAGEDLENVVSSPLEISRWQGMEIKTWMVEAFQVSYKCLMPNQIQTLENMTGADLPWAENHFQERVFGIPTNPGDTYMDWPYYKDLEYRESGKFTHTYQERFWPSAIMPKGIRFDTGDLFSVIQHLWDHPDTRQAYLPVWFPEDTGVKHGGRVPCTLGYLFNQRNGYLHLTYYIRSCDYIRHLKNDIYLAIRLAQDVLENLRRLQKTYLDKKSPLNWDGIDLGFFTIHIESLHMFNSDEIELKKRLTKLKTKK